MHPHCKAASTACDPSLLRLDCECDMSCHEGLRMVALPCFSENCGIGWIAVCRSGPSGQVADADAEEVACGACVCGACGAWECRDSAMMRVKRLRRSARCESADAKSLTEHPAKRISALSADSAACPGPAASISDLRCQAFPHASSALAPCCCLHYAAQQTSLAQVPAPQGLFPHGRAALSTILHALTWRDFVACRMQHMSTFNAAFTSSRELS